MSAVILQVGQCGNQLGLDWCELLTKSCAKKDGNCSPFGTREGRLALVCVDSEPKVLNRARQLVRSEKLLESNVVQGKGGRGGNWAYGYHGNSGEESNGLLQQAMEALRKEAERRSYYGGTVLLHSLSGGTGSGLGSRLCEEIRAEFPAGHILTASVVPHRSGESPLQHYNSLLGLAALHRSADGMLLFHNDQSLSSSGVPAPGRSGFCNGLPQGSLSPMNVHIASCMAGLLLPVRSLTPSSGLSLGAEPWELIRSLCPMPAAKLLHTTQACSSEKLTWDRLASITLQAVPKLSPAGKPYSSRAVLAVARGDGENSFIVSNVLPKLKRGHRCVPWNPFPIDCWTDPCNEMNASCNSQLLTVCSNHSSVSSLLSHVVQRCQEMIGAQAYLHWYQRYGVEVQDFRQSMDTLLNVIEEYETQMQT
ncbi:tubulin delta chain-like isoform X2 [Denticeps clupeoides]|uniref:Tubulin delta chain n=1 Tax=Denticeps clupeoides TaxID=299321 RepID=A0AAY4CSD0_9TELE|nr:tubulin delta chain-like isoform X2 [Denticeps clupeoides]XP_028841555.1 tubulin delta chain-like isoform X2 [Denticeps clupeoides]